MSNEVEKKIEEKIEKRVESNRRWVGIWAVVFAVIAIIIGVSVFSLTRLDSGEEIGSLQVNALTCKSNDYLYPFFVFDNSDSKEFKLIVTFVNDEARSLSLQQWLNYSNKEIISKSETMNHAVMNKLFEADGMEPDSLGASYSSMHDGVRMGLYSEFKKVGAVGMKYFLLDNVGQYDYNGIKQAYVNLGLSCVDS